MVAAEDEEERRKTAITTKLDNAVKKFGAMVACRGLKGESLLAWVAERVKREGKRMRGGSGAADETAGGEMRTLEQEISKLVCYSGDRETITTRDVAMVVASSPEDVMFTTVDAITRRQTDRALLLLAELHRYDPKPQAVAGKLLALLARQYRMFWQAKFLGEKRINPRDVRALPPELAAELPETATSRNCVQSRRSVCPLEELFLGGTDERWKNCCCATWPTRAASRTRSEPSARTRREPAAARAGTDRSDSAKQRRGYKCPRNRHATRETRRCKAGRV